MNSIPVAHTFEFLGDELWSVVCDDYFGNVEPCYNVGLDELEHHGCFDLSEGFDFGPFDVVLDCQQDERFALWSFGSYFR